MDKAARIYLAGHRGLVGSALERRLRSQGYERLLTRTHAELDLTSAPQVEGFFAKERPEYVLLAAAKVGGIVANDTSPADFARENLLIQTHVIDAASRHGVKKLLFLGSSCIYPREAPQPIREESLLAGPLEPTNEAYAIAKIAGILTCRAYQRQHGLRSICAMPTNLYGPGDNFDLTTSHVLPALLRKLHEAREGGREEVRLWGTGAPRREFLHVDDLADACLMLMTEYESVDLVNVGTGEDLTIRELAELVADVVGFRGRLAWDPTRPDGTPRKLLDVSRLRSMGWKPRFGLREGIERTYRWYLEHRAAGSDRDATPATRHPG